MPRPLRLAALLLLMVTASTAARDNAAPAVIAWEHDDRAAFDEARKHKRFVLLNLEAVWCHWCHVMDEKTYSDAAVRAAIAEHYVPLRIDHDARPDVANRYREYGWPATIVFAPDGSEIVKRRGYIAPEKMTRLLEAIVADPSPEAADAVDTSVVAASGLRDDVRALLIARHRNLHDAENGGLRLNQKYVERDSVEYALSRALAGDAQEKARALQTLRAARALIDPVWGGAYQYSTGGDWRDPHYEKLAWLQGEYLRIYAIAYGMTRDPELLATARDIARYVRGFLASPDGAYFASQDADPTPGEHGDTYFALNDAARRARGMPRIDTHTYTHQTATIADGFLALHEYTGDTRDLADAQRAIAWIIRERALPDGGYRHDARDAAGPYLADSLAMGRALLSLYRATGEREWLVRAGATADFIDARFRIGMGYAGAARGDSPIAPVAQIDENIQLARFANLLSHYTGSAAQRAMAAHALAFVATPEVALARATEAGVLLADLEINADPLHLTVIGPKDDANGIALYRACLRVASTYKRLDWWDRREGPLPHADVAYPKLKRAAAFVCTDQRCSTPIVQAEDIQAFLDESASTDP
jgi:uncharacterized protein YyaL (SSP411 family)